MVHAFSSLVLTNGFQFSPKIEFSPLSCFFLRIFKILMGKNSDKMDRAYHQLRSINYSKYDKFK